MGVGSIATQYESVPGWQIFFIAGSWQWLGLSLICAPLERQHIEAAAQAPLTILERNAAAMSGDALHKYFCDIVPRCIAEEQQVCSTLMPFNLAPDDMYKRCEPGELPIALVSTGQAWAAPVNSKLVCEAAEHPDRTEIAFVCTAYCREDQIGAAVYARPIRRDADGKPRLGQKIRNPHRWCDWLAQVDMRKLHLMRAAITAGHPEIAQWLIDHADAELLAINREQMDALRAQGVPVHPSVPTESPTVH